MKRQSLGLLTVGVVLLLIVGACAAPPTSIPAPGPLDQIMLFETAYNEHDIESALALFADDSAWDWVFTVSTKKGVRNIFEYASESTGQWQFTDCQLTGDEATCKGVYIDDCMPPELTGYHTEMTFKFADGKISTMDGSVDLAEWRIQDEYALKWQSWGQENLPEDFAVFSIPGIWDQFSGDGEASSRVTPIELGQAIGRMCRGYASATQ